jgi:two-component system nitrogen regulation sensor histidine kinase NtrY
MEFVLQTPDEGIGLRCDSRQVARALANVLKNAAESIERRETKGEVLAQGQVIVTLGQQAGDDGPRIAIVIEDNGVGLPEEQRDRLTEPYVTTREKGTGLGLAIVKKIMEDHNGDLILEDGPAGGARVSLIFNPETVVADVAEVPDPVKAETDVAAHGS